MALRLIRALPGEAAFLAPVADGKTSADVAPRSRRQDHTTSPYAASVSPGERTRLTPQRPSQPAPRSVTIAQTSLLAARAGRTGARDLPDEARENFRFHEFVKTESMDSAMLL